MKYGEKVYTYKDKEEDSLFCWSVDFPNYLKDIVRNCSPKPEMAIETTMPIVLKILAELAQTAIEIDDPRLHLMMMRLNLYELTNKQRMEKMKEMVKKIKEMN